ncbi:hypothetical protein [Saccharopolyspora phatthalungensis]|uniref:Uncharacterized membrane protein YhaH (DUF805 family) n=1 Tax=Saccharopolyspora phatthalungensis TaxID=664693 RepID=A0A840PYR2_9PSEU|nr:hypothetical protein [Saccharopolyspora phatthalungensis]MBB5152907.1 uncharacterized membrane protein YhaH (DUF805 family) [Saccharopolyspora phatthalungensis]
MPRTGVHVRAQRGELARLYRAALNRPRWQQVLAFGVSLWTLAWIMGQFLTPQDGPTALGVLGQLAARLGLTGGSWAERLTETWQNSGGGFALLGGLLWAATTERGQLPALLGWVAVMLGSERLGYQPAVLLAVVTLVGFVFVLWLAAALTNCRFVDRRTTLLPRDVVRAGVTAAALSAVVPLFAPAFFLTRLGNPYVTKAPRILARNTPDTPGAPDRDGWSQGRDQGP